MVKLLIALCVSSLVTMHDLNLSGDARVSVVTKEIEHVIDAIFAFLVSNVARVTFTWSRRSVSPCRLDRHSKRKNAVRSVCIQRAADGCGQQRRHRQATRSPFSVSGGSESLRL